MLLVNSAPDVATILSILVISALASSIHLAVTVMCKDIVEPCLVVLMCLTFVNWSVFAYHLRWWCRCWCWWLLYCLWVSWLTWILWCCMFSFCCCHLALLVVDCIFLSCWPLESGTLIVGLHVNSTLYTLLYSNFYLN